MTTKAEFVTQLKAANPTLKTGDDENGYTNLSSTEYDATISGWADARVAQESEVAEAKLSTDTKASAIAKLTSSTYMPLTSAEAATVVI